VSTDLIQQKMKSIRDLLNVSRKEIEAALPAHLTPDRLLRIVTTEIRKTPALLECSQASLLGAVIQSAQVGLEPGGALGHCYLVPFKGQVQLIVGYRGFLELANRSDRVSKIIARAVYSGDEFEFEYGLNERLVHKPGDASKRGQLSHVYCVVTLKDGAQMFDVMAKAEVDAIRNRSKAGNSGPWVTDYEAMAKKTAVRRLFKFMPASIEAQRAVGLDEMSETENGQDNESVIGVEGRQVPDAGTSALRDALDTQKKQAEIVVPKEEPAPAPVVDKPKPAIVPVITPVQPKGDDPNDRAYMVELIGGEMKRLDMGSFALEQVVKKRFSKKPTELNIEELKIILAMLQQEGIGK